jgi:hypothetical protein
MKNFRRTISIGVFICSLILILCFQVEKGEEKGPSRGGFLALKNAFKQPGKEFGSAPLWVWNTKVTKTNIDSMMQDYKDNGFGGVIIHARPGLITEYLSEEWYNLFKYAQIRGKELGLNVWIYDENSYPTGFAGGLVSDQMPEASNQGQMLYMKEVTQLPEDTKAIFICLKETDGHFTDITGNMTNEKGKSGKYRLITKVSYQKSNRGSVAGPIGVSYVDLMAKGVTQKFIDVTFKGYERVSGSEFGKTVQGSFSDEPTILNEGTGCIRWTPDLFAYFKQRWGYNLEPNLPSLFEEVGDWKKTRHNYHEVLLQLFIDRWSKPMSAYMTARDLIWTGHYWEHGWPSSYHGPDNMAMYAWHQMPGIDMLFNQFSEEKPVQFGNIRAVRELGSVANQLGKKRTLSETYGGSGWELTFKDMKRLADWEFALGVNFLNQHLSFMTITGCRKYDYPPSFSYHEPWWPYYKSLNWYFARLSLSLSSGEQKNDVLIIEPTTSAWMYFFRGKENARFFDITKSFNDFVTAMQKAQTDYDLGSENIIKDHGKIVNGKFVIGNRAYTTVVIPPGMENINRNTFKLLKEYARQGGKVVMFERLKYIDGDADGQVNYFSTTGSKNILHFQRLEKSIVSSQFSSPDFSISGIGNDTIGGNLYHQRRQIADGQLLFLSNASMTTASKGQVTMRGKDALLMDLFNGDILDYSEKVYNGKVTATFNIPAAGSLLLFMSDKKLSGYKKYTFPGEKAVVQTSAVKVLRPIVNTLMIDFCDLQMKKPEEAYKDLHVGVASNTVFKHNGFVDGVGNPWNNRTQFKNMIVARDTFSKGTGYTATYYFDINSNVDAKNFKAVIEQPKLWTSITINGIKVQALKGVWWLDRSFGVYEIGKYLKPGKNDLAVSITPMSVYAEIEPVYILGNFNLESEKKGWEITQPTPLQLGSWNKQGMPMYGQGVKYLKEFNVTDAGKEFEVQLDKWHGTVAAVRVNNVFAGTISSEPNSLMITPFLKRGNNQIEIEVIGSLKNLLGPHHNKPAPGLVDPGKWYNIKHYPAGKDYDTYDYGLEDDFKVQSYDQAKP